MKIIITGASGFVGRNIIPLLANKDIELLLVSRTPKELNKLFPNHPAISYEDLKNEKQAFDAIVHLAVINNDSQKSLDEFREVNVHFLTRVIDAAA